MIPTIIGLPASTKRTPVYDSVQTWLQGEGFGVYRPQVWGDDSDNLSQEYDPATEGLKYSAATLAMLRQLPFAVIFVYGGYHYLEANQTDNSPNPKSLNWPDPDNPTGKRLTQDELSDAQLTFYLRKSYLWLIGQKVKRPMMLVDEPSHRADDGGDGSKYGWTLQVEARIVKFVRCARSAGWTVAAAIPGPVQLAFWQGRGKFPTADGRARIQPDIWLLNDGPNSAGQAQVWPEIGADVGLYNAPSFVGLAERLSKIDGRWYLHFGVEPANKKNPLPALAHISSVTLPDGTLQETFTPTPEFAILKAELSKADEPSPEPTDRERIAVLEAKVSALLERVRVLENPTVPAPLPSGFHDLALFYTSDVTHWRQHLATLATYHSVVIQADFSRATKTSNGETYAFGKTPLEMLEANGCDVLLYFSPWWVWTAGQTSGPAAWLREAQRKKAESSNAWLRTRAGETIQKFGAQMTVADPRNRAYTDWMVEALSGIDHDTFFIDNAFWHQGAYHKWTVSDPEWANAATAFYDRLRQAGKRLILNAGWEMETAAEPWKWPLREHCDGVAIEIPAGFTDRAGWWALFDYQPMDTGPMERVALDWKSAGKGVYIIARHKRSEPLLADESPFPTLAEHRRFWRTLGKRIGVPVSAQANDASVPSLED